MYSIDDINVMVCEYKNGKAEVLEELLDAMKPYLSKWVSVLTRSCINTLDEEVQSFVSLFGYTSVGEVRSRLQYVFYHMTHEDIYNELVVRFIERILLYEDRGRGFLAYLKGTFRYVVKRWVDNEARGILLHYQDMDMVGMIEESEEVLDTDIMTDPTILSVLTRKERRILYLRYIDENTSADIARVYNISTAAVAQIIAVARGKLGG